MQCVAPAVQMSPAFICRVASHLLHPGLVWMSRDPSHAHTPAFQMNEEQYIIGHQSAPGEHLDGKEVNASQNRHVGLNELPPRRVLAPPGRWLDAVTPQHVADGLVRHVLTHVGQRSHDSKYPQPEFSRPILTISASRSCPIRGRPGYLRCLEPSNLLAISLRYQARMVAGLATRATS